MSKKIDRYPSKIFLIDQYSDHRVQDFLHKLYLGIKTLPDLATLLNSLLADQLTTFRINFNSFQNLVNNDPNRQNNNINQIQFLTFLQKASKSKIIEKRPNAFHTNDSNEMTYQVVHRDILKLFDYVFPTKTKSEKSTCSDSSDKIESNLEELKIKYRQLNNVYQELYSKSLEDEKLRINYSDDKVLCRVAIESAIKARKMKNQLEDLELQILRLEQDVPEHKIIFKHRPCQKSKKINQNRRQIKSSQMNNS